MDGRANLGRKGGAAEFQVVRSVSSRQVDKGEGFVWESEDEHGSS